MKKKSLVKEWTDDEIRDYTLKTHSHHDFSGDYIIGFQEGMKDMKEKCNERVANLITANLFLKDIDTIAKTIGEKLRSKINKQFK